MPTTVEIPSFDWSAFYYAELLEALIQFKRVNVPELTEESAQEPLIQLLRAFACVGHLNNTNLDVVANEFTLPTANLPETIRNMLKLIDYELSSYSPSQADVVGRLVAPLTGTTTVLPQYSQVATRLSSEVAAINFEFLEALSVAASNVLSKAFAFDEDGPTYTDYTTEANSAPGDDFTPWGSPAIGDCLYLGHTGVIWDKVNVKLDTNAKGITGVWEYHDGDDRDASPDDGTVEDKGSYIRMVVNGWLGTAKRQGTIVRVQLDATGGYETDLESQWGDLGSGNVNYVDTSGLLGQTSPSTTAIDYTVGSIWKELTPTVDTLQDFTGQGDTDIPDTDSADPDSATDEGAYLQFVVNGLLGAGDQSGTDVRVQLDLTEVYEDCVSLWGDLGGGNVNYIDTTGELGQGSPSTTAADYTVFSSNVTKPGAYIRLEINDLLGSSDENGTLVRVILDASGAHEDILSQWSGSVNYIDTSDTMGQGGSPSLISWDYSLYVLTQDANVEFSLPESASDEWLTGEINSYESYWLRYRIVDVTSPITGPVIDQVKIDTGRQYVKAQATQGTLQTDSPLGISDGSADQEFTTTKDWFIDDSQVVTVAAVAWIVVDNFLQSKPTDRHYVVRLGTNDRATFVFGNGTRGARPDIGATIVSVYRYGANVEGNVGANAIVVDKSGLSYIDNLWNPRTAVGWQEAQSASEESLELAKVLGPASLRVRNVALGPDDVEYLTKEWIDSTTGAKPFSRAVAIEEGYGPKTIKLVVVAAGGGLATSPQLEAIELYFNGDKYAAPPIEKHLVANQEVTAINYTQKVIDVTATVYGNVEAEAVRVQLTRLLQPEAKRSDGVTFEWHFGGTIYDTRLIHEIFETDPPNIEDVVLTVPSGDTTLVGEELPVVGTLTITVIAT